MRQIISASRRTDLPAFYLDWLITGIQKGFVEVENPFNNKICKVSLRADEVGVMVLWSKDFGEFLYNMSAFSRYNLYFQFTVNDSSVLEPRVIPVDARLGQLEKLVGAYGPETVNLRFDPIVFWDRGESDNLGSYRQILTVAADLGVKRCTTSFETYYKKTIRKMKVSGIDFFDPDIEMKKNVLSGLNSTAKDLGLELSVCCQPEVLIPGVRQARCIDSEFLGSIYDIRLSRAKDTGQRKDCRCNKARDIGSYSQKCGHKCIYCYAD